MRVLCLCLAFPSLAGCSQQSPSPTTPPEVSESVDDWKPPRHISKIVRGPDQPVRDAFTPAERDFHACTGPLGQWMCSQVKPSAKAPAPTNATATTYAASGSTPAYPPSSWAVSAWFWDPANSGGNANDGNNCTASGTPCLHWYAITNRWGTTKPILAQSTSFTVMSSQSAANMQADPVFLDFIISKNGAVTFSGVLNSVTQVSTGTITVNAAKSRSGKQLLSVTPSGTTAANDLMLNTTHVSRSYVDFTGPDIMSQPLTATTTITAVPTEVDTWATSDAYTEYAPASVNVVEVVPTISDNATTASPLVVDAITFADPNWSGGVNAWTDVVVVNGPVIIADSFFQKKLVVNGGGYYPAPRFTNDAIVSNAQIIGPPPTQATGLGPIVNGNGTLFYHTLTAIFGGFFFDDGATYEDAFQNVWIDGDTIFQTGGIGATFSGTNVYGCMAIRPSGAILLNGGAYMYPSAPSPNGSTICGSTSIIWVGGSSGTGTVHIRPSGQSTWSYATQTATNTFLAGVVLHELNSSTTACSHTNANNPDVINCNITLNVANLDAAQGLAGFGGYAFLPGGATYTNNP